MRHVSSTHRVALSKFFHRINSEPKMQKNVSPVTSGIILFVCWIYWVLDVLLHPFQLFFFLIRTTFSLSLTNCSLTGTPSSMSSTSRVKQWGVLPRGDIQSSHKSRAQAPRQLRLLRDFCNHLPGWIRQLRFGAFVHVRCGTRQWLSAKSAIFITVHSGEKNQRTWDKLITLMKKVCCQLSPFSHPQVRGDPCTNLVRAKNENQVATRRTKESRFSLKDKKSKFSLKSELISRSTKNEWNYWVSA